MFHYNQYFKVDSNSSKKVLAEQKIQTKQVMSILRCTYYIFKATLSLHINQRLEMKNKLI